MERLGYSLVNLNPLILYSARSGDDYDICILSLKKFTKRFAFIGYFPIEVYQNSSL